MKTIAKFPICSVGCLQSWNSCKRRRSARVNASIRDRYFGAASMTPGLTFPRLLKLSIHHAAKAERVGQYLEKIKSSIMAGLPAATLPRLFDLNQQGLFAIGYYHQREKRFEKGVVHD
jgi:CRISPR-associated protein Csd1